jgi:hypothetical protein
MPPTFILWHVLFIHSKNKKGKFTVCFRLLPESENMTKKSLYFHGIYTTGTCREDKWSLTIKK